MFTLIAWWNRGTNLKRVNWVSGDSCGGRMRRKEVFGNWTLLIVYACLRWDWAQSPRSSRRWPAPKKWWFRRPHPCSFIMSWCLCQMHGCCQCWYVQILQHSTSPSRSRLSACLMAALAASKKGWRRSLNTLLRSEQLIPSQAPLPAPPPKLIEKNLWSYVWSIYGT